MKSLIFIAIIATLAGCATVEPAAEQTRMARAETAATDTAGAVKSKEDMTQEEKVAAYNEQADKKDKVICRTITPTGSHRKKRICRSVKEIEDDRRSAQEAMRQIQNPGTKPVN